MLDDGLYVAAVRRLDTAGASPVARRNLAWSPDDELVYEGFNEDFGPLNLACTARFCRRVAELRAKAREGGGGAPEVAMSRRPLDMECLGSASPKADALGGLVLHLV